MSVAEITKYVADIAKHHTAETCILLAGFVTAGSVGVACGHADSAVIIVILSIFCALIPSLARFAADVKGYIRRLETKSDALEVKVDALEVKVDALRLDVITCERERAAMNEEFQRRCQECADRWADIL